MLAFIKVLISSACLILSFQCFGGGESVDLKPGTLRIGILKKTSGAILSLAKDQKRFEDEGVDLVILDQFANAQGVAKAIESGLIDIGLTGLTHDVYRLAGQEGGLKVIGGVACEVPQWKGAAYVVSNDLWDQGVKSLSDIKTVTMAITSTGSTFHYMAGMLADKYNRCLGRDIRLKIKGDMKKVDESLTDVGEVNFQITAGFRAKCIQDQQQGHIIGYVGSETPWQVTGVFASSQVLIGEQREYVIKFMKVFQKACASYHKLFNSNEPVEENSPQYEEKLKMATAFSQYIGKISVEDLMVASHYVHPECKVDLESLTKQMQWYHNNGLLSGNLTAEDVVDEVLVD